MSDLEFNEQKENDMGDAFTEGGDLVKEFDGETEVKLDGAEPDLTPEEMDAMVDKAVSLIHESRGVNPKGSPTKLNKRSVLMQIEHTDELSAYFVHKDEDDKVTDSVYMLLDMWDDLGRPDVITAVVYPKDMLNS